MDQLLDVQWKNASISCHNPTVEEFANLHLLELSQHLIYNNMANSIFKMSRATNKAIFHKVFGNWAQKLSLIMFHQYEEFYSQLS